MQEIKKYTIDAKEYEIGHFMTSKSTKMLTRLTKLVLAPLGAAFTGADQKSIDKIMDSQISIDKALAALASNLDEDMVLNTIKELMSEVRLGTGMPIDFETHFMGETMHMLRVVQKVLEHNYGDFFAGVSGAIKTAVGAVMTQERQTSTPTSGGSSSQASRRSRK